jgi:tRNA (mo5U34)-methyltransferase
MDAVLSSYNSYLKMPHSGTNDNREPPFSSRILHIIGEMREQGMNDFIWGWSGSAHGCIIYFKRIGGDTVAEQKPIFSPEEILARIKELGAEEKWFHCIDLGDGLATMKEPVKHLMDLWGVIDKHIPSDLSGMRVLDIGCNAGFFSVAAKKRKADYVLGIDMSPGYIKQAEFVRDVLGIQIDYRNMSVYELPVLADKFDLVFCLGVIYHCSDPFLAARNVLSVTEKIAVVESALMDSSTLHEKPLWEFVFEGYQSSEDERQYNWWFPNMSGLEAMFRSAGFTSVGAIQETASRGCIVCHK